MKIPYCFLPERAVRRGATLFYWLADFIKRSHPQIALDLKIANIKVEPGLYLAASLFSDFFLFVVVFVTLLLFLLQQKADYIILVSLAASLIISIFVFFQQMTYPNILIKKKVTSIEKQLVPALRTMQIQIGSGIPLYNVLVSIASEDYGGVSEQFKKALKEIDAGMHQVEALENIATENPSVYFQRVIWQIVTAIKSGFDMSYVLSGIIKSLSEENLVQIQEYGSKLNPLTMFYMLLVVIVPALAITFFIVIASFMSLKESALKSLFFGLYGVVMMFQLFFMTMIASKRPHMM